MLKARFRLSELQCLTPVSRAGDEVFVIFAGESAGGDRVVRVQPERKIGGRYGWFMTKGRTVKPGMTIEQARFDEFGSGQYYFVLCARDRGTYLTAISTASKVADVLAGPVGQFPMATLLFQLPESLTGGDRVLGSFLVAPTNLGNDLTTTFSYGNHTQPPARSTFERLKKYAARLAHPMPPEQKETLYECRGNESRYLVNFSIESVAVS